MTDRKTVAGAHARIDVLEKGQTDHEELCATRYGHINEKLDSFGRRTSRIEMAAWAILVTVAFAALKMAGVIG